MRTSDKNKTRKTDEKVIFGPEMGPAHGLDFLFKADWAMNSHGPRRDLKDGLWPKPSPSTN
jgi:hypothetical protein